MGASMVNQTARSLTQIPCPIGHGMAVEAEIKHLRMFAFHQREGGFDGMDRVLHVGVAVNR